jgi:alpha-beta hydrolase superfamily lysophospholipase
MTAAPVSGLVVYVGGLAEKREAIEPLLSRLDELPEVHGFDHYVYTTPVTRFSRGPLADRGDDLATAISNYWETQGKPSTVILMGHSIGGLLVRQAYLVAAGGFGGPAHEWVSRVSRIVLFASPNRGIDAKRFPILIRWAVSLVTSLSHGWSAADIIRGAPFLANLRIQWMRTMPAMAAPPLVVQVLGTRDTAVVKEDSVDLEAMPNSTTIEVYGADHQSIVRPTRPDEDRAGEQFQLLARAVAGDFTGDPQLAPKPAPNVPAVVFLLHGIRAGIFGWVDRLRVILTGADPAIVVEHGSYGYLSAFKFMLPWGHDRQLRQFAEWYAQMLSTYGPVDFHFVGHSNGTYILGRSLERVPAMTFTKVYLAGSVLRRNFPWADHRHQVTELVNACGSKDFPVAVLCGALRGVGRTHLGIGGYAGFDDAPMARAQYVTISGGHGAGLVNERLPAVADYVLHGTTPAAGDAWQTADPPSGFDNLSKFSPWLARLFAAGFVAALIGLGLWHVWAAGIGLGVIALILIVLSAV